MAECGVKQDARMHFRIQFFFDEFFTRLALDITSEDHPEHFLINGLPIDTDGHLSIVDTEYQIRYKPTQDFLKENGLLNQLFYVKTDLILKL